MSYAAEVQTDNSGNWYGNALRFATEAEADGYGLDLAMRWTLVRNVRSVESSDPVNYEIVDHKLKALDTASS